MSAHLTESDLNIISNFLNTGATLKEISGSVSKDPRGIKRIILKYRSLFVDGRQRNKCGNKNNCTITNLCHSCLTGRCNFCSYKNCNEICEKFQKEPNCPLLKKSTPVCNGCEDFKNCKLPKFIFNPGKTFKDMQETLVSSRKHIHFNQAELDKINAIIEPLIKKGISLEVIKGKHYDELPSIPTLYKLINEGYLNVINLDLKRKVSYRKRVKRIEPKPEYNFLENRYYEDFLNYLATHSNANIWEIDTVEGKKDGKAFMTLLHRKTNFMLIFLINSICTSEIINVFELIKNHLDYQKYKTIFEAILGDLGKEFRDPLSIETNLETGEKLINFFYCDSRQSQQKGKIEKNHEHMREIVPKGTSFETFSQKEGDIISLNVNNYPRAQFQNHSPLEIAGFFFPKELFQLNSLKIISVEEIILKPYALTKK